MNGVIAVAVELRQLDIAVAVCLLLWVALLLLRFVWQPAKRLWIIEWALIGGLLLAVGGVFPWQQFSLGVLRTNQKSSAAGASSLDLDPERSPLSRRVDAAFFEKADNGVKRSTASSNDAISDATQANERDTKII